MTNAEIIEKLKAVDGVSETYQVLSRFKFFRETNRGTTQEVSVEILDAGSSADTSMRYHCVAKADDGRSAHGNPDSSIEFALMTMHWEHLDYPV